MTEGFRPDPEATEKAAKHFAVAAVFSALGQWARATSRVARPALPDARDLHVYGGGLLVALGAGMYSPAAGLIVFGALLLYLGRP